MEDEQLLQTLRTQPETGLWELTQKYGALISAVVRRILPGAPEDAEECVSDTLVRLWRDCETIQLQNGTLRGFVIWTARNTALDRYRRLHREQQRTLENGCELLEDLAETGTTATAAEENQTLRTAEDYIKSLPPPDDTIFLRRFFLGETVPQIAKALKMNVKAVESRLQRGRPRLREHLKRKGVACHETK